ncbi:NADPH-dependent FMN reductase [Roseococcus sp. YIM B11640]|uniref:NADPH-dependent FMN reductase n=1 Tax=Roseococcus sp. YIM B11640 TaxID=3133973 RepID=UPI003C7D7667
MKVLAICGSLRAASYNRSLLRTAAELAPAGMEVEMAEIRGIPVFDEDLEKEGMPEAVAELRLRAKAADGLLIGCPEYNYGIAGPLKNAVDWLSRPHGEPRTPFINRPVAILGASMSLIGTARAQAQLRQTLQGCGALTMPSPEVYVIRAQDKFDAEGKLTDQQTRDAVGRLMAAFGTWIARLKG